jgi:hypothetical protein
VVVTAPTLQAGDLLFLISACTGAATVTAGVGWEDEVSTATGGNRTYALSWKLAETGDSGKAFTLTRNTSTTDFWGVAFAFRGANQQDPIDAVGFVERNDTTTQDIVTFVEIDPVGEDTHVVLVAYHYQDITDFTTAPTGFTTRVDLESADGADMTFAVCSKDHDGSAITPDSWASNSSQNSFSSSVQFAINATASDDTPNLDGGEGVLTDAAGPLAGPFSNGGDGVLTEVA